MANYRVRKFSGDVSKWIGAVETGLNDTVEIFGGKVQTALVEASPVDTGRYRGNWQVTANQPPMHALNNYDKQGGKTISEGKRALHAMLANGAAVRSIYFSNMLIYANSLEYGHSKQAPAGVAGIISIRLSSYMTEAIKEARLKNAL